MSSQSIIQGEKALYVLSEHWIRYAKSAVLVGTALVIYIACIAASASIHPVNHALSLGVTVMGHVLLLLFHHAAFYHFLSASTNQYLISNRRILGSHQNIWFSDQLTDIPLWRIRSVEVQKTGLLQHMLNYGSLVLNSGELPTLQRIPHPHTAHTKLMPLIQDMQPALERNRDGVTHMKQDASAMQFSAPFTL